MRCGDPPPRAHGSTCVWQDRGGRPNPQTGVNGIVEEYVSCNGEDARVGFSARSRDWMDAVGIAREAKRLLSEHTDPTSTRWRHTLWRRFRILVDRLLEAGGGSIAAVESVHVYQAAKQGDDLAIRLVLLLLTRRNCN